MASSAELFRRPPIAVAGVLALAVGLVALSACGTGGTATPSGPAPGPSASAPPVRTVLISGASFVVRAGGSSFVNIDFPPAGKVDVTVSWGGPNTIDIYVTDASCPGFQDVAQGRCPILGRAEGTTRPKSVNFDSQAGRIYTVWSANRGTTPESVSLDAAVTTNGPIPPTAPTPPPAAPSAPRPSPTPADLAPGPVAQLKAYIKTIETEQGSRQYRPGEQDADGNWILHPGEFVVFDLTQRNAAGQICGWEGDPDWSVKDPDGVLRIRESSHPFFLRVNIDRKGYFELQGSLDGLDSNVLRVNVVARGN
jgi:hypothetical protein